MKLNYKRTLFIGFAFMAICSFWQLYDGVIPLILKNDFSLGDTLIGVIMSADNILAVFLLPIFGAFSDRINTRFGKRTPFIIFGTILSVISMMFLPYTANKRNLLFFFITLGIVLISMSFYRSPAVALMPDLTPKPLRSKANAVINLMGAVGGVYTLVIISLLVKNEETKENINYLPVFIFIAVFMLIALAVLLLTINENKLSKEVVISKDDEITEETSEKHRMAPEVKRSLVFLLLSVAFWFIAYNAVQSTYSRYIQEVMGINGGGFAKSLLIGTIAAVISYIPVAFLSNKLGRKKLILIGIVAMTIGFVAAIPLRSYNAVMYFVLAIVGFGWAAINVNSYPMVVEMSKSSDIGKYTGYYYTFSMAAQVITPILSGRLIEMPYIGYRVLFPYAAFFSVLAFVTMLFVKHGDSKPIKKASLIENIGSED